MTKFKCEHHNKRIGIDVKNNNKPIYFPFCCHLWRARPPRLHFLSECSFLLVLCPSWIMDYLSAISQCNHIQQCSSSCAVCFRDDASLNFLCAPSELSLHSIAVSSIDLQLFSLLLFYIICWGLCEYSWPEICILKLKYCCYRKVVLFSSALCSMPLRKVDYEGTEPQHGAEVEMKDEGLCHPKSLAYIPPFITVIAVH